MGFVSACLHVEGVQKFFTKLLTRITTLLQTSSQSEVCTQSCGPLTSQESQFWEFQDSHLGVSKQNDIWVLVMWLGIEYTIRGKVMFPQVQAVVNLVSLCLLMVRPCTKVFQVRINQLVVWFGQSCVSN